MLQSIEFITFYASIEHSFNQNYLLLGQFLPGGEKVNRWQKSEPNCSMCMNFNDDPVYPLKCGRDHHYCTSCIKHFIEKTQVCPSCHKEGIRRGNQPIGCMTWVTVTQNSLPGYEDCDVIIMYFKFEEGIQGTLKNCINFIPWGVNGNISKTPLCNRASGLFYIFTGFSEKTSPGWLAVFNWRTRQFRLQCYIASVF